MGSWNLFYDGGCNLCHSAQLRAERWAIKAGQPLDVDVLASEEGRAKGYSDDIVLEADGQVFRAANAWMKLLTIAPWYLRWLSICTKTKPTMALAGAIYRVVARYRIKWFGSRECNLAPQPEPGKEGSREAGKRGKPLSP